MTAPPAQVARLLEVRALSKRFTGTLALDQVDFSVARGEVHALLGQNGAGKSTLIKLLAGVYPPTGGEILVDGRAVVPAAEQLPINFIHQDLGLVDSMTVAENVAILAGYPRRRGLIDWSAAHDAAARALAAMGADIDPGARVAGLGAAEKSIVAIARALSLRCDFLVLDEPTAALPEADVARLMSILDRLRTSGLGIIYVTHRLDEVFRIADRVTVLRDGRKVATVEVAETTPGALVAMIVGRTVEESRLSPAPGAQPVLELDDICLRGVGPVSLRIGTGEILGLVGLRGAGHHAIGRAIFGDESPTGGRILLRGHPVAVQSPAAAMRLGIGFVSSKRGEESLARSMTVQENIYLNPTVTGTGLLQARGRAAEFAACDAVLGRYTVRPREPARTIATLSGGNQQKVVIARWLEAKVKLLVLEEPTIGVDVGSKADIYRLLQQGLMAGMAVLLLSSDFEEVEQICHRALVFNRGRVTADIPRTSLTVARLTALAGGGVPASTVEQPV